MFSFFSKLCVFVYRFFISLKLAVFSIALLALLTAIGTFIESKYDQETADRLLYHSFWMSSSILLLALNLLMVLIDRFPWKKQQIGFVLAHIGILSLITGAFVTKHFGLDGSLRFKEGEKTRQFSVRDMEIQIYSSYDGESFQLIHEEPFDIFSIQPGKKKAYLIEAGGEKFFIDDYIPFALGSARFRPADAKETGRGPALRFHLKGSLASVTEWMSLKPGEKTTSLNVGPATIKFSTDTSLRPKSDKELFLYAVEEKLFYSSLALSKKGTSPPPLHSLRPLPRGKSFPTGWMDFHFRLLEFFPKAKKEFVFQPIDRPSSKSLKALRVRHKGSKAWLGENSYVSFFTKDRVYAISYLNKPYDLGFDIELIDFRLKNHPSAAKAKSYESEVRFKGKKALISMNHPLKEGGWTLYQSSFELAKKPGGPETSILSVNKDPGRPIKYFGSALIVAGIALLFYRRRIAKTRSNLT